MYHKIICHHFTHFSSVRIVSFSFISCNRLKVRKSPHWQSTIATQIIKWFCIDEKVIEERYSLTWAVHELLFRKRDKFFGLQKILTLERSSGWKCPARSTLSLSWSIMLLCVKLSFSLDPLLQWQLLPFSSLQYLELHTHWPCSWCCCRKQIEKLVLYKFC